MNTAVRPAQARRRLSISTAFALLAPLAVALTVAATPAHADPTPPTPTGPEQAASIQAVATGQAVHVDADNTAYTDTMANPDGSFSVTIGQVPVHVLQGSTWVTPDATLHTATDGSVVPAATAGGLRLSGGGTGPLATFDDHNGHTLSMTFPMTLPRPTLSGATATYPAVLPGVDLAVTATVEGGINEVLVVHNATAAANPTLAHLTLTTATTGLTVAADATTGALTATDPATGNPVFAAPPPRMWDSTMASPGATPNVANPISADTVIGGSDGAAPASTADSPGAAALVTPVAVQATGNTITLVPPTTALTGAGVTYPLYVDPSVAPTASPEAYVESYHASQTAYNPSDNLRTGFDDWPASWVNGITRTYLQYDISAVHGKYIQEAHLQMTQISVSDGTASHSYEVKATNTCGWGSNLTWNNQPCWGVLNDATQVNGALTGHQIGVTNIVSTLAPDYTRIYLVVHNTNESNDLGYKHWALHPALVVTYWSTPDQPKSLTETNGTKTYACNTTSPGTWIPAATNNQIQLNYTMSTPDVNTTLYGNSWLSTDGGSYSPRTTSVTYPGGNYPVHDTYTLADGSKYSWYAQADNTHRWSAVTSTCYFQYDATPPTLTPPKSTDFPANGPTTVGAGGSGTITLSASDGGTNPSGVSGFTYNLNGTSVTAGGNGPTTVSGSTATLTVPLSSLHWGTNTLWVQANDTAGNVSQPQHYDFYVQQSAFGPYNPGTAGDLDGDNSPDLVTVDAAGNVRMFSHPDVTGVNPSGNTTTDPLQYGGTVILSHDKDSLWPSGTFAGALVTHAGSYSGRNADDLLIEQNGNLAVAGNTNGNGSLWQLGQNIIKPPCAACVNYTSADWSSVTQMVAVPTTAGKPPKLLTLEYFNGTATVWLYTSSGNGTTVSFGAPVAVSTDGGSWHWTQQQFVAAGPLPGSTGTTLWTRDPTTGALSLFHNLEGGIATPASAAVALGTGFDGATHPLVTTTGRADTLGNLPLWTTDASGNLQVVPTTTSATGATALGGVRALSTVSGWGAHEVALGSTYVPYNDTGMLNDTETASVSFDGGNRGTGYAYSAQAMAAVGVQPGGTVSAQFSHGTYAFAFPQQSPHTPDSWECAGQTIAAPVNENPVPGPGRYISFLGAATGATAAGQSGTATITYTDGHTQQITIALSDWTLVGGTVSPLASNTVVATGAYRIDTTTGNKQTHSTNLFATAEVQLLDNGAALPAGVQIASITLPSNVSLKIFAVAVN